MTIDPLTAAMLQQQQGINGQQQPQQALGLQPSQFGGARGAVEALGGNPQRPGQTLNLSDPRIRNLIGAMLGGRSSGEGMDRQFLSQAQLAGGAR